MQNKIKVWDIPTRLFHWLLVLLLGAQWFTGEQGEDWLNWHMYIGYATIALIIFRLLWGFVGSHHARFVNFIASPKRTVNYALGNDKKQYAGHNPMGGWMILVLLGLVLLQGVSGLFTTDEIFFDSPYRSLIDSDWQDRADWLHGNVFDWLLYAVALHILAVLFYWVVKKQNLIRAMFTGTKAGSYEKVDIRINLVWLCIAVILLVAIIAALITLAPPPIEDDYF